MVEFEEISEEAQKRINGACDVVLDCCADISRQDTKELGGIGINENMLDNMVIIAIQSLIWRHQERLARAEVVGIVEEVGPAIKSYKSPDGNGGGKP